MSTGRRYIEVNEKMEEEKRPSGRNKVNRNSRCLICYEGSAQSEECERKKKRIIKQGSERDDVDLDNELSTFFILRKVLGLPSEFLENLLTSYGSPSQWNIRLCRLCKRVVQEIEYIWERMKLLQRDYNKVICEIRDTLVNSRIPEELEILRASENEEPAKKDVVVKDKLKSCGIIEGVRVKFFLDLKDEDDNALGQDVRRHFTEMMAGHHSKKHNNGLEVAWNDKGVPYLILANIEKKMEELAAAVATLPNNFAAHRPQESGGNDSLQQNCDNCEDSPPPPVDSVGSSDKPSPSPTNSKAAEEEEEQPRIKIVENSKLLETDDEDTDAVPHVLEFLKLDFSDGEVQIIDGNYEADPLSIDDPDYIPENDGSVKNSEVSKNNTKRKRKSNIKFNSLKIKPMKEGPKKFVCSKCLATFSARLGCLIHILKDHYGETLPFHCNRCTEKFGVYHDLKEHMNTVHGSSETPYDDDFSPDPAQTAGPSSSVGVATKKLVYECPANNCLERFANKNALQRHTNSVHGASPFMLETFRNPGLECEICAKRSIEYRAVNKDILEIHYRKVHNINDSSIPKPKPKFRVVSKEQRRDLIKSRRSSSTSMKCPDCEKILPDAGTMADHIKNPEHKCPHCTKHFMFAATLEQHLALHHKNCNLVCPYCTKSFSTDIVFKKHIENHKMYDYHECEVCHVKVTGLSTLNRHITQAHPYFLQQKSPPQNPILLGL